MPGMGELVFEPDIVLDRSGAKIGQCTTGCPSYVWNEEKQLEHEDGGHCALRPDDICEPGTPCLPWVVFQLQRAGQMRTIAEAQCGRAQAQRDAARARLAAVIESRDELRRQLGEIRERFGVEAPAEPRTYEDILRERDGLDDDPAQASCYRRHGEVLQERDALSLRVAELESRCDGLVGAVRDHVSQLGFCRQSEDIEPYCQSAECTYCVLARIADEEAAAARRDDG